MFSHLLELASEKHFYHLASYSRFSYKVLRMYDVEKRSAFLEDAAGFARVDAHMYGLVT